MSLCPSSKTAQELTASVSGDAVGNTTLPAVVNETSNITTTQSPGEGTADLVNATLSTLAATNSSKTQNGENATSTDVGGVTGMPTDKNVTTTVIDTEVSVVDVMLYREPVKLDELDVKNNS